MPNTLCATFDGYPVALHNEGPCVVSVPNCCTEQPWPEGQPMPAVVPEPGSLLMLLAGALALAALAKIRG